MLHCQPNIKILLQNMHISSPLPATSYLTSQGDHTVTVCDITSVCVSNFRYSQIVGFQARITSR
jgi:hypothetical protein